MTRREAILTFIEKFIDEHGYPPTIREIGAGVGISSTSLVQRYLLALERDGLIKRQPAIARGIRLVGATS